MFQGTVKVWFSITGLFIILSGIHNTVQGPVLDLAGQNLTQGMQMESTWQVNGVQHQLDLNDQGI